MAASTISGLTVHEPLCPGLRLGHNELLLRPAQPLKDAVENANRRLRRHLLDDAASERPSAESLVAPARVRSCRTKDENSGMLFLSIRRARPERGGRTGGGAAVLRAIAAAASTGASARPGP